MHNRYRGTKRFGWAASAIAILTVLLVCTGCPNANGAGGGGGGGTDNTTPPVIGNYNAASGTLTVGSVTYMMKPIAGGSGLNLGVGAAAGDNNGSHTVTLTAYHMGETEVTQELWIAVMGNNPSQFDGIGTKAPIGSEVQQKRPVDTVTWFDCINFCNKLTDGIAGLGPSERVYTVSGTTVTQNLSKRGFRLPTDAEWEWAARGNTGTVYSGSSTATSVAWYNGNSGQTRQVAQKAVNSYGLYDMSGNVWEWCWDWHATTPTAGMDPEGPSSGTHRTKRGGSWNTTDDKCKCVYRGTASPDAPDYTEDDIGFRIVCRP